MAPINETASSTKGVQHSTALYRASCTFDRTVELAKRVTRLADRLCGAQPTEAGREVSTPTTDGVFGAIDATCRNVDSEISDAFYALDRIDAELP